MFCKEVARMFFAGILRAPLIIYSAKCMHMYVPLLTFALPALSVFYKSIFLNCFFSSLIIYKVNSIPNMKIKEFLHTILLNVFLFLLKVFEKFDKITV